jgi:hypothetical protein
MAETAVDYTIDVLGVRVPLRDFGVYDTEARCHAFTFVCVSDALRRRWSLPHLDWTVDLIEDYHVNQRVKFLCSGVKLLIHGANWASRGLNWAWGPATLDEEVLRCNAELESLPRNVVISQKGSPLCPVRWHGDIQILMQATFLESLAWQHNVVAEAVVLLGGNWHHPAVNNLSWRLESYTVQIPRHAKTCESAVRAVWNCVVTERVPPVIASVATVLPIVALPELVAEYVFGTAVMTEAPLSWAAH